MGRPQRDPIFRRCSRQIVFGKIRPVAWRSFISADHRDRALISFAPQHIRGSQSGGASPHNDNRAWSGTWRWLFRRIAQLFTDENFVSYLLYFPAGNRIERWRMQRFPAPQTETCVM